MAEDYHTAHPPGSGEHQGGTVREPTIRVESCRGDERCPECGGSVTFTRAVLPCGCRWHQDCSTITAGNGVAFLGHTIDLLTEALRERDVATADLQRTEDERNATAEGHLDAIAAACGSPGWEYPGQVIRDVKALREERDAAIRQVEEQRHPCPCGKDTASIKWARCYSCRQTETDENERLREEHAAAIRERQALDLCTGCAGTGKPVSGKPCICGGHGGIGNQIIGLTREAFAERERAEKAEATVARQAQRIQQQEVAWSASQARAEKAEALLLECREAVDYAAWAADEEFDEPHMKKFRDLLSRLPTLKEP